MTRSLLACTLAALTLISPPLPAAAQDAAKTLHGNNGPYTNAKSTGNYVFRHDPATGAATPPELDITLRKRDPGRSGGEGFVLCWRSATSSPSRSKSGC